MPTHHHLKNKPSTNFVATWWGGTQATPIFHLSFVIGKNSQRPRRGRGRPPMEASMGAYTPHAEFSSTRSDRYCYWPVAEILLSSNCKLA